MDFQLSKYNNYLDNMELELTIIEDYITEQLKYQIINLIYNLIIMNYLRYL